MTDKEFALMEYLMRCDKKTKKKFVDNYLIEKYGKDKCVITKYYTLAFGDIPVGLVAHTDTVFEETKKYKEYINLYYDQKRHTAFCPGSPGFDDTAGVFSILEIIKRGLRPTIILCQDEEAGVIGGSRLVKDIPNCPIKLKYIIELDRAGENDCVFYQCDNKEFIKYIESCGFKFDLGSYSDISVIGPAWKIATCNVSCGYENEHSYFETLRVDWMFKTIEKVIVMLKNATREEYNIPYFEYVEAKPDSTGWDPIFGISKEDWVKYIGG